MSRFLGDAIGLSRDARYNTLRCIIPAAMKIAPEPTSDPLRTALLAQKTYATERPPITYFTAKAIFAVSPSVVDGYLIWLTAPESDLVVAYGAITSGTLLDCVIGEEKQISKTKDFLNGVSDEGKQQRVVDAYAVLFRSLQAYHVQCREGCCGGSRLCQLVYEPRVRAEALRAIEEEFGSLEADLRGG